MGIKYVTAKQTNTLWGGSWVVEGGGGGSLQGGGENGSFIRGRDGFADSPKDQRQKGGFGEVREAKEEGKRKSRRSKLLKAGDVAKYLLLSCFGGGAHSEPAEHTSSVIRGEYGDGTKTGNFTRANPPGKRTKKWSRGERGIRQDGPSGKKDGCNRVGPKLNRGGRT